MIYLGSDELYLSSVLCALSFLDMKSSVDFQVRLALTVHYSYLYLGHTNLVVCFSDWVEIKGREIFFSFLKLNWYGLIKNLLLPIHAFCYCSCLLIVYISTSLLLCYSFPRLYCQFGGH